MNLHHILEQLVVDWWMRPEVQAASGPTPRGQTSLMPAVGLCVHCTDLVKGPSYIWETQEPLSAKSTCANSAAGERRDSCACWSGKAL
ncbi:hypothetical protein EYF80_015838 [Liparis tanakae]|uniref:Uncharacterized protein n=1 Tax=Liparis tanakae TaxID=230148 RepID=A0A4Z2I7R2_9TELE|nr:hypothetical protein EYF80_015838 [Liparis tanakae]